MKIFVNKVFFDLSVYEAKWIGRQLNDETVNQLGNALTGQFIDILLSIWQKKICTVSMTFVYL